ncbi:RagB/SusD family nutrient uptake outer membrane protein [Bacteroides sp.]
MKKHIKYTLLYILGAGMFTSCDVMDTAPTESYDDATVWGSKSSIEGFIYGTYPNVLDNYTEIADWESRTPNGVYNEAAGDPTGSVETETKITSSSDFGFNKFAQLRNCNKIIENVAKSELEEGEKKELIAEGHFLRGLVFFAQARTIGRFVPITKVLSQEDTEMFKTPMTADIAESYNYVIADLQKAAKEMRETKEAGRANRFVASAYLSRAALQAYAYTNDSKYLTISKEAAEDVINNGGYTMSTNYKNMFLEGGANDAEIILARYYLDQNSTCSSFVELIRCVPNLKPDEVKKGGGTPAFNQSNAFEGWARYFPSQDLIDQYLSVENGKAIPWYETTAYKNAVDEENPASLGVGDFYRGEDDKTEGITTKWDVPDADDMGSTSKGPKIVRYGKIKPGVTDVTDPDGKARVNKIMYANRDDRFYGTIIYDSCQWLLDEWVTTCIHGNAYAGVRPDRKSSWYTTATGYYWRKGVYDAQPRVYAGNKTNYHKVLCRLSEMYLNLAEIYLINNDVPNAVKMLNETRVKHGKLPASTATTLEDAWKDYIRERRVEMAQENDLYWSYLRWGKYGGYANEGRPAGDVIEALNEPPYKIMITKDRQRFFIAQIMYGNTYNRNFTTKRYLLPISQSNIDKRKASGIDDGYVNPW